MDKDFNRTFTKCPCCDSDNRFCEQLGLEMKERGLAREEWNFHYDVKEGVVIDQKKEAAIPIGSEVPSFGFITDICMDCGCIYVVDIRRGNIKKPPPIAAQPNRAQRRRIGRDEQGPGLINPFSTS